MVPARFEPMALHFDPGERALAYAVSIVIPAFNEVQRIGQTLDRVLACIASRGWDAEVLVVDDGSTDGTRMLVERYTASYSSLFLVSNPGNRGKGYSVRNGLLQATGDVVMFTDADLSAPIEEAERLFAAIADGADVAIGSRWLDRTRQTIHQPLYRRIFGRCFNGVTRVVMGLPYADTQCGFKAFRRTAAQTIFRLQLVERWGFDPEILFIARRLGFRVREVPVTWGHDERSKVSYLRDGAKMLQDTVRIRRNSLLGRYECAIAASADTSRLVTARYPSRVASRAGAGALGH